jgi:50S ribosomal protein L16 3-hydroxylase
MRQIRFPEAVDEESFLRLIWQRKPLLMRAALPDYDCPVSADELAGLACEDEIESRVVIDDDARPWQLAHGPLALAFFDDLPTTRWTLLVQDVDKHVPAVAELLDYFTFLPDWRIDDVMVSYAADGGSVGPHIDEYDVFLVQVEGRRRWGIDTRAPTDAPLREDTELKILADFVPEHEWVLEPGDVLYLPPGVAHWGVAEGPCMTCSVGFRAPSWREMLIDFCDHLIEREPGNAHYRDPPLSLQDSSAEIPGVVFDTVETLLGQLMRTDAVERRRWFGRLVTEPKPHLAPPPREEATPPTRFHERLRANGIIRRHPWSRTAFAKMPDGQRVLFANGVGYDVPASCQGLLRTFAHVREVHFGYLEPWLEQPDCLALLARLYDAGVLEFRDDADV